MDLREKPAMRGVLTIDICDASGTLVERRSVPNLITNAGKALLANLLMGQVDALPTRWAIVVGSGPSLPKLEDTALERQVDEVEATPKVDTSSGVRAVVSATLPALSLAPTDKPQTLTEAGIRITQGAKTQVLFNRVHFEPVNRGANMVMKLTWEISF